MPPIALLDDVRSLIADAKLSEIAALAAPLPLPEISEMLDRLDPASGAIVFRLLAKDRAMDVFERLSPAAQADLVTELADRDVISVFDQLDPGDVVSLLDELPAAVTKRLLGGLSPAQQRDMAPILGYSQGAIGRRMSPKYASARPHETAEAVLARLREREADYETIYTVAVIDFTRTLVGITTLREIMRAEADTPLGDFMNVAVSVRAREDEEVAARRCVDGALLAVPVVDDEGRLVGILPIDDAIRITQDAEDEDQARTGGTAPLRRTYLLTSIRALAGSRAPWLLVLAVSATLTVRVLDVFQATLEQMVALTLFIPLLTGTGGNAGAQAATTLTRALATAEVRVRDLGRVAWKEIRTGALLGLMLGGLGFLVATLIYDGEIGAVIGLTLLAVCTMAATIGGLMPIIAKAIHVDPAVFSTPFISTFCDATGLLIYFSIAQAVLGI